MAIPTFKEKRWKTVFEQEIASQWRAEETYDINTTEKCYIIDTPPPYINAPIHIGHATTYVLQDMFARYHRMLGETVIFPLGLDRNGLPIEVAAEKRFKVRLHELPREEAVQYCERILKETSTESVKSFEALGCSFTSWRFHTGKPGEAYMTDSPEYRSLTQDTFIDLWNKNLVYFDKRINNYSPGLKTTIADSEIDYEDLSSKFVHVSWKVKETGETIIIATTRPELIASCGMVIYNPDDDRYRHLEGKHAVLPLYEKEVPIKAHPDAKIDKGSGLVMMCSAGDYTDIRFFRKQNLKPIISIGTDGLMNDNAGFLKGLSIKNARADMISRLERAGFVEKIEHVMHRTPVCERTRVPIEFIEMEEIYLKQLDFLDKIKEVSKNIAMYDPKSRNILDDWMEAVAIDWPISRRRYYATEIPLWHCESCGHKVVPESKGKYWQPWKDPCPVKACPQCGGQEWKGEERVLDTWFDSSISPLFNMKYGRNTEFYKNNPTCTLRPQGKEIVRTWLYYTLLRCYQLTGRAIFDDVWIHHHVVDDKGRKFSKSMGNGINPQDIVKQYGAEAFRLWTVSEGNIHESDLRCSLERIGGLSKTLTKLWNLSRFIGNFKQGGKSELLAVDYWILTELNKIISLTKECYDKYDFHTPAKEIRNFIWETFSSHYVELIKGRAYNTEGTFSVEEQNGAIATLHEVIDVVVRLWSPVIPMLTTALYHNLYEKDVTSARFPTPVPVKPVAVSKDQLTGLNSEIWKRKRELGMSLKQGLERITLPEIFKEFEKDLRETHSLGEISYGSELSF